MRKLFCLLAAALVLFSNAFAAENKKIPDPYYLNSDVIDMDAQPSENIQPEKKKKIFSFLKKKKYKRGKKKKISPYTRDKQLTPATEEDYDRQSKEILRAEYDIPKPEFEHDKDFIVPEPQFKVIKYNTPAGGRNIDLSKLAEIRAVSSAAMLSPDKTKMVYTKSFFYPQTAQTASAAYVIPVKNSFKSIYSILYETNIIEGSPEPIFTAGMDYLIKYQFKVLSPIDFNHDGSKAAFKEKIGSNAAGTWVTNILIYDFKTAELKRPAQMREAVVSYWRTKKNIQLSDFMWDVYPLGWDKKNHNRILFYAYAYTYGNKPLFLGLWRTDAGSGLTELISLNSIDAEIELNGYGLIEVK